MCELVEGKLILSASIVQVIRCQVLFDRCKLHILWILHKVFSILDKLLLQFLQISNTLFKIFENCSTVNMFLFDLCLGYVKMYLSMLHKVVYISQLWSSSIVTKNDSGWLLIAAQIAPPPVSRIRRPRKANANEKENEVDKEREGIQSSTTNQELGLLDAEESQSLALVHLSSVKLDEAEPFAVRLVINSLDQILPAFYILMYLCASSSFTKKIM